MSRKPLGSEAKKETISYRITRSFYAKLCDVVNASDEPSLSDYARNALIQRMEREGNVKTPKNIN